MSVFHQLEVPSKHKTFVKHLYNVGPASETLGRRYINVIQMFCVCWVVGPGIDTKLQVGENLKKIT